MGGSKGRNLLLTVFILSVLPLVVFGDCTCDSSSDTVEKSKALKYKIGSIVSILIGGAAGICLPVLGKAIPALRPERDVFFIIKAFAAGVILATGFIHVLPNAFDNLTSPCLSPDPWGNFPFTGFIAMMSSIFTLLIDAFSMSYFSNKAANSGNPHGRIVDEGGAAAGGEGGEDLQADHGHHHHTIIHPHVHTHDSPEYSQLLRHRVISQVLELGIIMHSVIIGVALGASQNPSTIRPNVPSIL